MTKTNKTSGSSTKYARRKARQEEAARLENLDASASMVDPADEDQTDNLSAQASVLLPESKVETQDEETQDEETQEIQAPVPEEPAESEPVSSNEATGQVSQVAEETIPEAPQQVQEPTQPEVTTQPEPVAQVETPAESTEMEEIAPVQEEETSSEPEVPVEPEPEPVALCICPHCGGSGVIEGKAKEPKVSVPRTGGGKRKDGLRAPQVRVLKALAVAYPGYLNRKEISNRAPVDLAWVREAVGAVTPEDREKLEAKMGYPSLITLGLAKVEVLDVEGKKEVAWQITDAGRAMVEAGI